MAISIGDVCLKLGLDKADFDSGMASIEQSVKKAGTSMGDNFKKVGIAAGISAGAMVAGLGMATKAAADEEVGIEKLRQALANAGVSYDDNRAAIEGVIAAQQNKTKYGDGEQRDALAALIGVTGDYQKSLDLMGLTMDVATAKNMDLTSAAEVVGRVSEGNTSILGRYGVQLKEGATSTEALTALTQKFGGQAEAAGQTASGMFAQLQNTMSDMMEEIGAAILPLLKEMLDIFKSLLAEVDLKPIIEAVTSLAKQALPIATKLLGQLFDIALKLMPPLLEIGEKIFPVLARVLDKVLEPLMPLVEKLLPPLVDLLGAVLDVTLPLIEAGLDVLVGVLGNLLEVITPLVEGGLKILTGAFQALGEVVNPEIFTKIGDALSGFWESLKGVFIGAVTFIQENWDKILAILFPAVGLPILIARNWGAIVDKVQEIFGMVKEKVKEAFEAVVGFVKENWDKILAILFPAVGLPVLIAKNWGEIVETVKGIFDSVLGIFGNFYNSALEAGKKLVMGLWDGIVSLADWVFANVRNFAANIFGSVKEGLGKLWPFSPSEAGVEVGEGLTAGIVKGIRAGLESVKGMAASLGEVTLEPTITRLPSVASASTTTSTSQTVNVNISGSWSVRKDSDIDRIGKAIVEQIRVRQGLRL